MRKSWDEYFMDMAIAAAARGTCPRLQVGAILVRDRQIIATGYNGSIHGAPHCTDVGCIMDGGSCIATVHAEVNAIISAARNGHATSFSTAYVTHNPCLNCYKALHQAGVKRIIYGTMYREVDYGKLGLNDNQAPTMNRLSPTASENS